MNKAMTCNINVINKIKTLITVKLFKTCLLSIIAQGGGLRRLSMRDGDGATSILSMTLRDEGQTIEKTEERSDGQPTDSNKKNDGLDQKVSVIKK